MIGWVGLIETETEIQMWEGCEGRAQSVTVNRASTGRERERERDAMMFHPDVMIIKSL